MPIGANWDKSFTGFFLEGGGGGEAHIGLTELGLNGHPEPNLTTNLVLKNGLNIFDYLDPDSVPNSKYESGSRRPSNMDTIPTDPRNTGKMLS